MNKAEIPKLLPAMSNEEVGCLKRQMRGAKRYVEFGSGGSTLLAVQQEISRIVSVESDPAWADLVRSHGEIRAAIDSKQLSLHCVNIGPIMTPGYPKDPASARLWPAYYTSLWDLIDPQEVDLFLVDGRFRVACALSVIRRCRTDATILVHDWERTSYHEILGFAHCITTVGRLAVLRRQESIDWPLMCETALRVALDPS